MGMIQVMSSVLPWELTLGNSRGLAVLLGLVLLFLMNGHGLTPHQALL